MDCYCDFDPPDVYTVTLPKARKRHRCSECGRAIQPGEQYERVTGIWDGTADTFKTCPHCLDLRKYVKAHVPCFCWHHGNMTEDAIETADYYAAEAPGLLFGAYRRLIQIKRRARRNESETNPTQR